MFQLLSAPTVREILRVVLNRFSGLICSRSFSGVRIFSETFCLGVPEITNFSHHLLAVPTLKSGTEDSQKAKKAMLSAVRNLTTAASKVSVVPDALFEASTASPIPPILKYLETISSLPSFLLPLAVPALCQLLTWEEPKERRIVFKLLLQILGHSASERPEIIYRYLQALKIFHKTTSVLQRLLPCAVEFWFFAGDLADEFLSVLLSLGAVALPTLKIVLNNSYLITPS